MPHMVDWSDNRAGERLNMVRTQIRLRGIHHERLLAALADLPRELFVPPPQAPAAYEDRPLAIGLGQTISQPYVVALMIQELDPQPTDRVLDVGAGSGYQTALLARLCRHVYAVERIEELAQRAAGVLAGLGVGNVSFSTRDGSLGWLEQAPFDRIICGAGGPEVPRAWIEQLADGGRIVAPIGGGEVQTLVVLDRLRQDVRRRELCPVRFVRLIGQQGWAE
ncbi:MAG: Protein-L-isoaspartate O-methyltransferase [Planctomycetes bacterium ADurb.Bin126]|nr:MAG: Protein-L-isoaspartate O-methyltransferase [Planctomycetes bacterium ADurb.Bin126]